MAGFRDHFALRSVGLQPPTIKRPCFICSNGLNGRKYCYYCGNTKDLGGQIPGTVQGRTSSEITQCTRGWINLERGCEYVVVLNEGDRKRTIQGVCVGTRGPFVVVGNYNIHLLEIDSVRKIA